MSSADKASCEFCSVRSSWCAACGAKSSFSPEKRYDMRVDIIIDARYLEAWHVCAADSPASEVHR